MAKIDLIRIWLEKEKDAALLVKEITDSISKNEHPTWKLDTDKKSFVHTGEGNQWLACACLLPTVTETKDKTEKYIKVQITIKDASKPENTVRGVYLGRFSSLLVTHFETNIRTIDLL